MPRSRFIGAITALMALIGLTFPVISVWGPSLTLTLSFVTVHPTNQTQGPTIYVGPSGSCAHSPGHRSCTLSSFLNPVYDFSSLSEFNAPGFLITPPPGHAQITFATGLFAGGAFIFMICRLFIFHSVVYDWDLPIVGATEDEYLVLLSGLASTLFVIVSLAHLKWFFDKDIRDFNTWAIQNSVNYRAKAGFAYLPAVAAAGLFLALLVTILNVYHDYFPIMSFVLADDFGLDHDVKEADIEPMEEEPKVLVKKPKKEEPKKEEVKEPEPGLWQTTVTQQHLNVVPPKVQ